MVQGLRNVPISERAIAAVALTVSLVIALTDSALAGRGRADEAHPLVVAHTCSFTIDDLCFHEAAGYDLVTLGPGDYLSAPGAPMVPARTIRLAIPPSMTVTGIEVIADASVTLPGTYRVFPAQPPRPVSSGAGEFRSPDAAVYASAEPYPATLGTFAHQSDLAGQNMAIVRLFPVQYVPATKTLRLHTTMTVILTGETGHICGDYLPAAISDRGRTACQRQLETMVANPAAVAVTSADRPPASPQRVEPGQYDYVIVTTPQWDEQFQPLLEWKLRKGVAAKLVNVDWIYDESGYAGEDAEKIRAFIQDARENWGSSYFLLGGDTNALPCGWIWSLDQWVPNDTYYADFDGDFTCEVHVGRAPVRHAGQAETFVNKVLAYEKTPPAAEYVQRAAMFGFDLYMLASREGEFCKSAITGLFLPQWWTYSKEYDCESGPHKSDCLEYLNAGHHLVNHIDHSSTDYMGTGYVNHDQGLGNGDMAALVNGARQSILYSIGCWPCDFPATTCIAEAFVRNPAGGGVAFVGNSRSGWYQPYTGDTLSMRYDQFFFKALFQEDHHRLGEAFSVHKAEAYLPQGQTFEFIYTELTLLGDPEMPVWMRDPKTLAVTCQEKMTVGKTVVVPVTVLADGQPLEDATVCLWKGQEVYAVAETGSGGTVKMEVEAETTGPMLLTVTGRDCLPHEGLVEVVEAVPGDVTGDAVVNVLDLEAVLGAWGPCDGCEEDLDGDGTVGLGDVLVLLEHWD